MNHDEFLTIARGMYAEARVRFREMAAPLVTDDETRVFVESLTQAIGEVSPDEAYAALVRWKAERR
jgi:hypothetical protein